MKFKKFILFFYFFLMIYKPEFIFIYPSVNTFFGILGLGFYLTRRTYRYQIISNSKAYYKPLFISYLPVVFICLFSIVINASVELHYVKYFVSIVLYYFMAYLGAWGFYKVYSEVTPKILINYFVAAALLHVGISLAMFANSTINDLLLSLIRVSKGEADVMDITLGSRLQGFGATFYTSGLINGYILIILAFTMYVESFSFPKKMIYLVAYVIIFVVGIMIARTIMIGGAIGLLVILYSMLHSGKDLFKNILIILFSAIFLVFVGIKFISASGIDFEQLSQFGFEMFRMLAEGETSSHSTDSMMNMYDVIPDNLKTWIIGDSQWVGKNGGYYKEVDIGYLRNIFYFGILGSLFFYLYNWVVLKRVVLQKNVFGNKSKIVFLTLIFYTVVLNFKGTVDLYYYILPYYFCFNKKLCYENR